MKSQNQVVSRDYQGPRSDLFSLACSGRFLASSVEDLTDATNEDFSPSELPDGFYF